MPSIALGGSWTPSCCSPVAARKAILRLEGETIRAPIYAATGHILYERTSNNPGVWALPFSLDDLTPTGDPFLVVPEGGKPERLARRHAHVHAASGRGSAGAGLDRSERNRDRHDRPPAAGPHGALAVAGWPAGGGRSDGEPPVPTSGYSTRHAAHRPGSRLARVTRTFLRGRRLAIASSSPARSRRGRSGSLPPRPRTAPARARRSWTREWPPIGGVARRQVPCVFGCEHRFGEDRLRHRYARLDGSEPPRLFVDAPGSHAIRSFPLTGATLPTCPPNREETRCT